MPRGAPIGELITQLESLCCEHGIPIRHLAGIYRFARGGWRRWHGPKQPRTAYAKTVNKLQQALTDLQSRPAWVRERCGVGKAAPPPSAVPMPRGDGVEPHELIGLAKTLARTDRIGESAPLVELALRRALRHPDGVIRLLERNMHTVVYLLYRVADDSTFGRVLQSLIVNPLESERKPKPGLGQIEPVTLLLSETWCAYNEHMAPPQGSAMYDNLHSCLNRLHDKNTTVETKARVLRSHAQGLAWVNRASGFQRAVDLISEATEISATSPNKYFSFANPLTEVCMHCGQLAYAERVAGQHFHVARALFREDGSFVPTEGQALNVSWTTSLYGLIARCGLDANYWKTDEAHARYQTLLNARKRCNFNLKAAIRVPETLRRQLPEQLGTLSDEASKPVCRADYADVLGKSLDKLVQTVMNI
jgi:hypothetical protein